MSEKGFYADKPLLLADRLEGMGFYLDEEAVAVIRAQHAEIGRLNGENKRLKSENFQLWLDFHKAQEEAALWEWRCNNETPDATERDRHTALLRQALEALGSAAGNGLTEFANKKIDRAIDALREALGER